MMPRDVATRWNSTYDMLNFALEYRSALDHICSDRDAKLRQYELLESEWKVAKELCQVLKVRFLYSISILISQRHDRYLKTQRSSSLVVRLSELNTVKGIRSPTSQL
jgi:hypothetical protein